MEGPKLNLESIVYYMYNMYNKNKIIPIKYNYISYLLFSLMLSQLLFCTFYFNAFWPSEICVQLALHHSDTSTRFQQ